MSDDDFLWSARMEAAKRGDESAHDALLRSCTPHVRRVARALGVASEDVDDVVQETLITVHRARHTFEAGRSFAAWLNAITRRRAIDHLRWRGRLEGREVHDCPISEDHADASPNPEESHEISEANGRLYREVKNLSPGLREAVETLGLGERTLEEAAAEIGKTKGALKVSFHRALNSLRERLGRDE